MTIKGLSDDKIFLDGLRNGEFCLVLGAGFSYGLKNKATNDSLGLGEINYNAYRTIPLVNEYVKLTNNIFNDNVSKGEAAANIWSNHNFSIEKDNEKICLKTFYKDLFTLDEDWFRTNKLEYFKNILIPNWYQVYTFNFDNVFESIVKLKGRTPFYSLHFPAHSGIKRTNDKAIVHLHGYIAETPPDKLTFSDDTYDLLRDTKHTLYDQFYTDIDSGKKLIIIGTQFDEKVIDDKFFDGLKNKNITIYHFDLYNDNFKTKPGIYNNPNYHFIEIKDTEDVLEFFEKNKIKIESIDVDGAHVINSDFINNVKKEGTKQGFTASDFYLAKQLDECQWYGVINNWVVERDNYQDIKGEVISSFSDASRISKISALLWGKGGSGKSTLLRKLAVDLSDEEFVVLWIKDKEMQLFYEKGLFQLREFYQHKQVLIVIEDLYRVKQQDINLKEVIDSICDNKNIRLIVGDRKNDDTSYKEHIYNADGNIFELTVDDNKKTLHRLLENIPEWKKVAELLLTTDEDYKSTMYYILWTIGRTAQKNEKEISTDLHQDLVSHFRSLVESDLKELSVNYPGVAKMLYYWASIYASNKIYIAYDLFFKLSDLFKTQSAIESKLILASPVNKSILDIYINKAKGFIKSAEGLSLLTFNHDILAEEGLSRSKLNGWHPFDNSIKLTILPVVVNEGDNFSASVFLTHCWRNIPDALFSHADKSKYVNTLKAKGNFGHYLVPVFTKNFYSLTEKVELAEEILSQNNFTELHEEIVNMALKISKDKSKIDEILFQENFWNLPAMIVSTALNISKDKERADKILSQKNFWNLPFPIVCAALHISKDKGKSDEILSQENFWNLQHQVVITALDISKDKGKSDNILSQENFWNLDYQVVCKALNISKNKDKANKILSQENFWNLHPDVVSTALNISKDKDKADKILYQPNVLNLKSQVVSTALNISNNKSKALEILSQKNFWTLQHEMISTALNISKDKDSADKILSQENFWNLSMEIVSTALNISKDKDKANKILSQEKFWNLPYQIVSIALKISKDKDKIDKILSQENFWNLDKEIVSTALNISKDKDKADKILSQENLWNLDKEIVGTALYISENEKLIENVGKTLLASGKWREKWGITYHILQFYSKQKNIPKQVTQICSSIIVEYFDKNNYDSGKQMRYINLMRIPLHSIASWKKSSSENIMKWKNITRNLVTNIIVACRSNPNEVKEMCKGILSNWRNELTLPIYTYSKKIAPHYGDHIRLSLGHPDLKELATKTAIEIYKTESVSPGVPEHLITVVKQIVNESIFPDWA